MNCKINQPKRRHKRYQVSWEALLEIDSPDFYEFMHVPILNLSRAGALVHTPQIYMHHYHLSVAAQNDELNLIIHSPLSELDSRVRIRHYQWDESAQGFNIGVEFRDICEKNQDFIDEIIKGIGLYNREETPDPDSQFICNCI